MTDLLAFPSDDGGSVLVEVEDMAVGPVTRGGRTGDHVVEATESLGRVLGKVGPAVKGIVSELRARADFPAEVEVEFTVKVAADSNVIIARAGGEAHFRIALRWSSEANREPA
jgi:hypothetical protein